MFEDAIFESTGRIHTRSRRWMMATFAFNSAVVLALALFPLLHPEALPGIVNPLLMVAPPPQAPPPQPPPQQRMVQAAHASEMVGPHIMAPRIIPPTPYVPPAPETPVIASVNGWEDSTGKDLNVFREPHGRPAVRQERPATARISQGVMEGLLIRKVVPAYPPLARTMGIEGTVVLQASISTSGKIENLRVVTGPELLQKAAIDAVNQWLYRPYLLNGTPVEVETTVNVTFTLH